MSISVNKGYSDVYITRTNSDGKSEGIAVPESDIPALVNGLMDSGFIRRPTLEQAHRFLDGWADIILANQSHPTAAEIASAYAAIASAEAQRRQAEAMERIADSLASVIGNKYNTDAGTAQSAIRTA